MKIKRKAITIIAFILVAAAFITTVFAEAAPPSSASALHLFEQTMSFLLQGPISVNGSTEALAQVHFELQNASLSEISGLRTLDYHSTVTYPSEISGADAFDVSPLLSAVFAPESKTIGIVNLLFYSISREEGAEMISWLAEQGEEIPPERFPAFVKYPERTFRAWRINSCTVFLPYGRRYHPERDEWTDTVPGEDELYLILDYRTLPLAD